jgi:HK97 family phage major capsid protein
LWESATAEIVETFQDGIGRFYYETTEAGERFLGFPVAESESMPTIAASAFPILFGDFSGYAIVERLGLAIVRFMDSNTSVNKVEYQVRRRIGGDVIEPYKFAVNKVSA